MTFLAAALAVVVLTLVGIQYRRGVLSQPVALAAVAGAIVLVPLSMWFGASLSPRQIIEKSMTYRLAAAATLGSHLASHYPGAETLVLSHPDYRDLAKALGWAAPSPDHVPARIEQAFLNSAGDALRIRRVLHPPIPDHILGRMQSPSEEEQARYPEGVPLPSNYQPGEFAGGLSDADYRRAIMGQVDDCELLVILVPGMEDLANLGLANMADPPRVAMLHPPEARDAILEDVGEERVVAVVVGDPNYRYDHNALPPTDRQAAFDERYLLVTPENVDRLAQKLAQRD